MITIFKKQDRIVRDKYYELIIWKHTQKNEYYIDLMHNFKRYTYTIYEYMPSVEKILRSIAIFLNVLNKKQPYLNLSRRSDIVRHVFDFLLKKEAGQSFEQYSFEKRCLKLFIHYFDHVTIKKNFKNHLKGNEYFYYIKDENYYIISPVLFREPTLNTAGYHGNLMVVPVEHEEAIKKVIELYRYKYHSTMGLQTFLFGYYKSFNIKLIKCNELYYNFIKFYVNNEGVDSVSATNKANIKS